MEANTRRKERAAKPESGIRGFLADTNRQILPLVRIQLRWHIGYRRIPCIWMKQKSSFTTYEKLL